MIAQEVLTGRFYENKVATACINSPQGGVTVVGRVKGQPTTYIPQYDDGMLDLYREHVKFGLMTFDNASSTSTSAGGGYSWGPNATVSTSDYQAGTERSTLIPWLQANKGLVLPNSRNYGAKHTTSTIGALVASGYQDDFASIATINQKVQQQIIAATAEDGTPLAAFLHDARHYYDNHCDERSPSESCRYIDSTDSAGRTGRDPYAQCRPKAVIMVADGGDSFHHCYNPSTRFSVNSSGGISYYSDCYPYPFNVYKTADLQAESLLLEKDIKTYVIGFGPDADYDDNLRRTAFKGGTCEDMDSDDCYFKAQNFDDLYDAMTRILSDLLGVSTSRSRAATTSRTSFRADNVGMYEVSASFQTTPGNPFWKGSLERVTYECSADGVLEPTGVIDFADGLLTRSYDDRKIFTSTPALTAGSSMPKLHEARATDGSLLFPTCEATATDQVLTTTTVPRSPSSVTYYSSSPSSDYIIFPGGCSSNADCPTAAGTTYQCLRGKCEPTVTGSGACTSTLTSCCATGTGTCQSMCYAGACKQIQTECTKHSDCDVDSNGDGTINDSDVQNDVCHLGTCTRGWRSACTDRILRRQPLGDIAHSNPLIVGGPELDIPIPSYQAFRAAHGNRDTMVYVGANDGMLHAFLLGEMTPKDGFKEGDELWAYVPRSIQSRLDSLRYGRSIFVDGSPVVKDIQLYPGQFTDPADIGNEWRTVMIGSLRGGGRAYFALDITDPYNPKYLWEINSDSTGFSKLGLSYGEPAMGMVQVIGSDGKPVEKAVAILPGGVPSVTTSTTQGRAVYVVDLATGQLLRSIETITASGSGSTTYYPITGSVTGYNAFAGSLLTRAFMGDQEGRLLRLDLSSTDPLAWNLKVFFDPKPYFSATADLEPVMYPPAVALNDKKQLVIIYGNGNVDNLTTFGTDKHFIASITETFGVSGSTVTVSETLNWMNKFDVPGEKMTGAPTVYNSVAYFPTFVPNSTPCEFGFARIYAADFDTGSSTLRPVAVHSLDQNNSKELTLDFGTGTVIYGAEVANRPSCVPSRSNQTPSGSGGGSQPSSTDVTSSQQQTPQLVLHTGASPFTEGSSNPPSTTDTAPVDQKTDKLLIDLPQPDRALKTLSWSALYQ
jgi:Tfp pilus tip-associated adhesin PilY1